MNGFVITEYVSGLGCLLCSDQGPAIVAMCDMKWHDRRSSRHSFTLSTRYKLYGSVLMLQKTRWRERERKEIPQVSRCRKKFLYSLLLSFIRPQHLRSLPPCLFICPLYVAGFHLFIQWAYTCREVFAVGWNYYITGCGVTVWLAGLWPGLSVVGQSQSVTLSGSIGLRLMAVASWRWFGLCLVSLTHRADKQSWTGSDKANAFNCSILQSTEKKAIVELPPSL